MYSVFQDREVGNTFEENFTFQNYFKFTVLMFIGVKLLLLGKLTSQE